MQTLVHLSDLHFGTTDTRIVDAIGAEVRACKPDLVVISGDLTQRARRAEFCQAREFLDALPTPQIVVPGNHDVPLFNIFARTLTPLARYKHFIQADTDPFYANDELAVVGINTARSFTIKDGRINAGQLAAMTARFAGLADETTKIVVTHHPFEGRTFGHATGVVGRAKMAMEAFSQSRVDIILSGHHHLQQANLSTVRYAKARYAALLIQAGTAVSTRRRDAANSFNIIRVERPRIRLECRAWQPQARQFSTSAKYSFGLGPDGWVLDEA
ncbi:metallophosphoesterase [Mesorhizobium australicum]|uniref:Metallophosphoesterase n=1 Tax=Mesorhizobium australicum TaxID=536018 RepID=A0ACC6T277_9HYPH|nr:MULTISPECIES: metallophosphoesterase [unclassified Mesorhizobium]ESY88948.1 metallophosphatase [Mesorhizobium sp. LNHC220B00]